MPERDSPKTREEIDKEKEEKFRKGEQKETLMQRLRVISAGLIVLGLALLAGPKLVEIADNLKLPDYSPTPSSIDVFPTPISQANILPTETPVSRPVKRALQTFDDEIPGWMDEKIRQTEYRLTVTFIDGRTATCTTQAVSATTLITARHCTIYENQSLTPMTVTLPSGQSVPVDLVRRDETGKDLATLTATGMATVSHTRVVTTPLLSNDIDKAYLFWSPWRSSLVPPNTADSSPFRIRAIGTKNNSRGQSLLVMAGNIDTIAKGISSPLPGGSGGCAYRYDPTMSPSNPFQCIGVFSEYEFLGGLGSKGLLDFFGIDAPARTLITHFQPFLDTTR